MTNEQKESVYLSWLASVKMPADALRKTLMLCNTAENALRLIICRDESIRQILPPTYLDKLLRSASPEVFSHFGKILSVHGIQAITFQDPVFPHILQEISDPVSILFYQGNLSCLSGRTISMVGARQASYAGLKAARRIAMDLAKEGVSIVSGFAYGIDASCHRGCIEGGSPTAAVLGCGLDQNYPAGHVELRNAILNSNGVLLTEYAPCEKPLAGNFPYRNRIISGLGNALILMEAKIRSGSLRTVDHALSQGREVFVYPGDPSSPHFEGNHLLLREGGHYFTSARDILEDMNWLDKKPRCVQNSGCDNTAVPLSPEEMEIRRLLVPGALSFDQLADQSGILPPDLLGLLTMMQLNGMIEALPGKKYQIKQ